MIAGVNDVASGAWSLELSVIFLSKGEQWQLALEVSGSRRQERATFISQYPEGNYKISVV